MGAQSSMPQHFSMLHVPELDQFFFANFNFCYFFERKRSLFVFHSLNVL